MNKFLYCKKAFAFCASMYLFCFAYGQDPSVFHSLPTENNTSQLGVAFAASDTIPLDSTVCIYSFSIDATIHQPHEASFARLVLEDTSGHDYIVAESSWFRFDTTDVQLNHYCEETAVLDGVTPAYLKCYLTDDANITITNIHTSSHPGTYGTDTIAGFIKEEQARDIVDRINDYNTTHGRLWEAAVTDISLMPYDDKKDIYEDGSYDSYLSNMQYYWGGLFEVGEPRAYSASLDSSLYVPNFDWRNRHGKCWLTPVKSQGRSAYCVPFSTVSMLESNMMLHYNDASSIDLSEQYVASYAGVHYRYGSSIDSITNFLIIHGTVDEASMQFEDIENYDLPDVRPEGNEHVYLNDSNKVYLSGVSLDTIKKYIIHSGPGVWGYRQIINPETGERGGHAMTLAGYGTITSDTIYTYLDGNRKDTIICEGDSLIGRTFWIFKNSEIMKKSRHHGYMYVIFHNESGWYRHNHAVFPKGTPRSNVSRPILCEDLDGDGYFNWGVGSPHIPIWAESDGDDSDPSIGRMNEYGYCETLPDDHPTYEYIYNYCCPLKVQ